MDINIVGRNLGITERFRAFVTEKVEKLENLAERAIALEVRLSRHHSSSASSGDDRVELTLIGPGPVIRAESSGADKYSAFDLAFGKLLERVRRAKDRRKIHRGNHRPVSLREATTGGFTVIDVTPAPAELLDGSRAQGGGESESEDAVVDDWSPVVIRKKVFDAEPMTVDDALYQMELVGHDFYLFIDAESGRPSVVYRRKGWDYGVIGLEQRESQARASG